MKNSLKTSVQMFGVAGLVILAGCGTDTTVNDTVVEPIEIIEAQEIDQAEGLGQDVNIPIEDLPLEVDVSEGEELQEEAAPVDGEVEGEVSIDVPYDSPAGLHTMPVTMSVVDGVIVSASATPEADATNAAVKKWQGSFAESISEAVSGKSLADLQDIDAIGGASLTTGGFKKALARL